jgi:putative ABC transport system permease protein
MSRSARIARDVLVSLAANRSRTLLMMAGLTVGVAVLSAVIVVGQGTRQHVLSLVAKHGLDMIMVRAGGAVQVFAPSADRGIAALDESDVRAIEATIGDVVMVSAVQNQRGIDVAYEDRVVTTRAFGVEPDWMEIRRWGLQEGSFVSDADMAGLARVAILGAHVARSLFPDGGAVGRTIRVNGDPWTVGGVFIEMGASAGGDDWDDRIVVPFTTSSRRLFGRPYLEQIVLRVNDARRVPDVAEQVRDLLRVRHGIAAGQEDDFFVREPEDVMEAALETRMTLTGLLLAIGAIALLAGGIVIMNIMLLSVSQRAHEIGLRRALGARAGDITRQFLYEAVFVALTGAVVGVAVGVAVAAGLAAAGVTLARVTWLPFVTAVVACVVVALVFGITPARRAARLDPAAALRERRV